MYLNVREWISGEMVVPLIEVDAVPAIGTALVIDSATYRIRDIKWTQGKRGGKHRPVLYVGQEYV